MEIYIKMLILMRRKEEAIIIGGNILIKVLKIEGNQVHLGIEAPKEVTIYRSEILEEEEDIEVVNDKANAKHGQPNDKDGNC